jgi:uncharacterized protein DUF3558
VRSAALTRVPIGLAAALVVLVGCSSPTAGKPAGERSETSPPSADSTETGTSEKHSVNDLCGLLTEAEAADLGAPEPPEEGYSTSDGHPQCTWSGDLSLTVGWSAGKNTSMLKTGPDTTITPTEVHGISGVLSKETGSFVLCQVALDMPDGVLGAAVVLDLSGEGKYDECAVATDAMNIIIPKVTEK